MEQHVNGICAHVNACHRLQVYLFAEALAEGAVKMGMPSALAHSIASQTVLVSFYCLCLCFTLGTSAIIVLQRILLLFGILCLPAQYLSLLSLI